MEGFVLMAAWRWGSDNNVVNDPLEEPDCTPLYVGLPSGPRRAPWTVTVCFPHFRGRAPYVGTLDRYKGMNKPSALEIEHRSP
jgi:hypothetical protein